jgi:hypothetical protein
MLGWEGTPVQARVRPTAEGPDVAPVEFVEEVGGDLLGGGGAGDGEEEGRECTGSGHDACFSTVSRAAGGLVSDYGTRFVWHNCMAQIRRLRCAGFRGVGEAATPSNL